MTNRACKTCRHWNVETDQFTETGRLKKDAMAVCQYPIARLQAVLPRPMWIWIQRERQTHCGWTGKNSGIECPTWTEKT